jgi:amino-acid N-acetyltransferase
MRGESVTLQAADADGIPYVERLLERNELPTADLRDAADFYIATRGGQRVGIRGLEQYGTDALLRSLVVERATVPPAIAATTEFSDLCPSSAVCMTKNL